MRGDFKKRSQASEARTQEKVNTRPALAGEAKAKKELGRKQLRKVIPIQGGAARKGPGFFKGKGLAGKSKEFGEGPVTNPKGRP